MQENFSTCWVSYLVECRFHNLEAIQQRLFSCCCWLTYPIYTSIGRPPHQSVMFRRHYVAPIILIQSCSLETYYVACGAEYLFSRGHGRDRNDIEDNTSQNGIAVAKQQIIHK